MRTLYTIAAFIWVIVIAGFIMLGLSTGWALLLSVPIMVGIGVLGLWLYRKWGDIFKGDGLGI